MNFEDEVWVERTLIEHERQKCISKILSVDCENAVAKGNNYASDLYRLNVKLVLNSGDVVKKPVIYKKLPVSQHRRKYMKDSGLHIIEPRMFTEVFPALERIIQDREGNPEPLWPQCIGVEKGLNGYLLEDLTSIGYKMIDRRKSLDFNHCKLVMKALGKFHALNARAIEESSIITKDYRENYFVANSNETENFFRTNLPEVAKMIDESWSNEWKCFANRIRELSKTLVPRILDILKNEDTKFNTILHGDCWMTNMMFRYDENDLPQNIRFLDFQLSFINRPVIDLQYFLNTSADLDALKNQKRLLQIYYDSLIYYLNLYGFEGELPTLEYLLDSYEETHLWGISVALIFRPFMMQPPESVPDMEEYSKNIMNKEENKFSCFGYLDESGNQLMEYTLKFAEKVGLI